MAITNILDLFRSKSPTSLVTMPEEAPMMSLAAPLTEDVPQTGPQMSIPSTEPVSSAPVVNEVSPVESTPAVEVAPVTYQATTPHVSAFDPRAWSQPTADFFEAYTAGTAGSDFLRNYREIQGARADQEYKRLIANAQMLNALKSKAGGTSEVEKLQARADFLRGMGASDNEILQSFLKGSGTTINIGEKSAQRRTQNMDDLMAKRIEEDMTQLSLNDNMMALGDVVLQALESGQLSYVGKPFAEEVYKYGAKLGLLPESTEAAVQALQTLGTTYRAATLRPTVGGGHVTNIEQQIAGVAVPGVDKTETQNKTAIRAAVGLGMALRAAHNAYVAAYYRGASEPEAAQAALQARHAYTEQLYKELGLASGRDSTAPTTKKRVTKVIKGKNVTLEEGPDGNYYPVR